MLYLSTLVDIGSGRLTASDKENEPPNPGELANLMTVTRLTTSGEPNLERHSIHIYTRSSHLIAMCDIL